MKVDKLAMRSVNFAANNWRFTGGKKCHICGEFSAAVIAVQKSQIHHLDVQELIRR